MTRPVRQPDICSECVEYHEVPVRDTEHSESHNCSPRGTRWRLPRKPNQKACRSVHAIKITHDDGQGQMRL